MRAAENWGIKWEYEGEQDMSEGKGRRCKEQQLPRNQEITKFYLPLVSGILTMICIFLLRGSLFEIIADVQRRIQLIPVIQVW